MSEQRIVRNALYCRLCDTEIESTHVHDFRACQCGNVFVDGGLEYVRYGWRDSDESSFEVRTEYEETE